MAWSKQNRHERGYDNNWYRIRARVLKRDRFICQCRHCKQSGDVRPANEVDHITPLTKAKRMGWTDAQIHHPDNLQAINKDCHRRKTIEDNGGTYKGDRRIGDDGFPVEIV